ncbi:MULTISPECIES: NAD(P)-dependent malic enzyme [Aminobacterium]|jgi:malate dehydrogenase (oxaloacetate-decarboxylating)|uniref:Malate dehydrogenase (Oxaloacetate-decarboxylating) n=1 Tax=Aminobacterium colombiense (strain DSM 12261 / ALA-1) TaxID=572547 RepID=D5EH71_AMICL|nr:MULTISPECIES: malic enzyme-like NAD(P)-binding protein [Aminobacterium]MDD2379781.1 NAD-dependent malic enzyme [Aminobacterium colombiense]ADE57903.1 Malate dehydrogenase (oxaloacetate- decarboxylating) [Aminobacterium colombiense DSM 12261]MDD3767727.1 NAD-dependent malic enzyme [Aminobacterium colombiense]MDD4265946.1 NAD-dependent malic enzyme [Aminobacterium colombiense]MDD4585150.1 NAD-dependent malic enzyme [Aminobacterium colombiense]
MRKEAIFAKALLAHQQSKGKVAITSKLPVESMEDLAIAYTPGVAEPCREIEKNPDAVYDVTSKGNMVAVVTDGSAVLGLGDIGPDAALPVMEGKAVLFKRFANVDAFPICIRSQDPEEIVRTTALITPAFGGINLEDISAPRCFEIERRLKEVCDIPVFHDDQHGTAVIVLAGLINSFKLVKKNIEDVKIVMSGAGAAGIAICRFLLSAGAKNVILCDRSGAIYNGRPEHMNWAKDEIAKETNPNKEMGNLAEVLKGADVFLGISAPGVVTTEMVKTMAKDPILFAMANPTPEIYPDEAQAGGAAVVATGRSDFPNQINNCLGFPGIFRGTLDVRASTINEEMKLAASEAIASLISDEELTAERIIPEPLDSRVVPSVAKAVAEAARRTGVARI